MSQLDTILFPEITQQQSQDNTWTKRDKLQVEEANSKSSLDTILSSPEITQQLSTKRDEVQVEQANSRSGLEVKSWLNLHRAAMEGDWGTIESILENDPNALTEAIDIHGNNVLFVAAWAGHTGVVQRLLERVSRDYLERKVEEGTVLHIAAVGGNLEMVKALVDKHPRLTQFTGASGYTPLREAAGFSKNEEVVRYLYSKTNNDAPGRPFTGPTSGELIGPLVCSGLYDVAFSLVQQHPKMAVAKDGDEFDLLWQLSRRPSDFLSGSSFRSWERWVYHVVAVEKNVDEYNIPRSDEEDLQYQNLDSWTSLLLFRKYMVQVLTWINKITWKVMKELVPRIKHIEQEKLKHRYTNKLIHFACEVMTNSEEFDLTTIHESLHISLGNATSRGIIEIVTICCKHFPTLFWLGMDSDDSIFRVAIQYRREKIFNILYAKIAMNNYMVADAKDEYYTLLHAAATLAPLPQLRSIPCPAIQMQREIQWFKAVENLIPPFQRNWAKEKGQTVDELFTNEHQQLVKEAEKWMKDTSNSCMLVSTLIATVVFAAAFTIPGGNLEGKGTPILLKEATFMTFAISNALALFCSTTSILIFLSILTARYAEQDFLYALPKRLILGLASLFLAIATMMVAFGSALQIMLGERWEWCYIPTMVLGALPVSLFMMLQFPLFVEMVWSTYGPSIFRLQKIW